MGLNPFFSRFVKHILRDFLKVTYIKHMLSSSSSLKKQRGTYQSPVGEKREGKQSHVSFIKTQMVAISSITLKQSKGHHIYLYTRREHIARESHLTFASSILIESILPSRVVLFLFEGSHPVSDTSNHNHLSWPSPSHLMLISHDLHTLSIVSCRLISDSSIPSFDRYVLVDDNSLSKNLI